MTNVELLVFGAARDPTPLNNTIDAASGTFVILGGNARSQSNPVRPRKSTPLHGWPPMPGRLRSASGAGTLVLDQLADFQGTISNFGSDDTIALQGIDYSSQDTAVWTQTTTGPDAAGTLQIDDGATVLDTLNLAGTYNQSNFTLTSGYNNGTNGTDVVYTSSPVTTVTITAPAASGLDLQNEDPLAEMGRGTIQAGGTATTFTIVDGGDSREFIFDGTGFTYKRLCAGRSPAGLSTRLTN